MTKNNTGTYAFDKKTGKIIKISDNVPSVKKESGHTCGNGCGCHNCPHND
ncbi:MAG: hypothetical protein LBM71_00550 [Elusimicrobiota bacterium]|jgi:hypothetical protein|nr:hypothetical protein [Elusimicrobiota bacterium]